MTLNADTLRQSLRALGDRQSSQYPGDGTLTQAPGRLAQAYDTYARQAVDLGGNPLVAGNLIAMQTALRVSFATNANTPASAALAFGNAHTAYWTGAVFVPGAPPPPGTPAVGGNGIFAVSLTSAVVTAVGASLQAALFALFAVPTTDATARAQAIAQAWHTATLAVQVQQTGLDTTPPPAGPLPIVATGFLR